MTAVISVVVLSYNRPAKLAEALRSIVRQQGPTLEVIVVDNFSTHSADVSRIVAAFPGIRLLAQTENLGFATGMNIGMAAATGDYLHLIEDDVCLEDGFYAELLPYAETHPADLLSGLIYQQPETRIFTGATLEIERRFSQRLIRPTESRPYQTGMLLGMMMFGHRATFAAIGRFRDEFFVYFEDSEFCWRARQQGVRLMIVPAARVWHADPGQYRFKPEIEFHKLKNYFALNLLHMRAFPLVRLITKYFVYTTVRKAIEGRSWRFLIDIWLASLRAAPRYLLERKNRVRALSAGSPSGGLLSNR